MTRVSQRLSRVSAALALACALCVPVVAAPAVRGEVFIRLPAGASAARAGGHGEQIDVHSFSWRAAQPGSGSPAKSGRGSSDIIMKGSKIGENAPRGGGINEMSMDDSAGKEKTQAGAGEWIADVERPQSSGGSVWIRVAMPWTGCRAGTRYPNIELGDGAVSYQLRDVVVTRCTAGGASLNYASVSVRGQGPAR